MGFFRKLLFLVVLIIVYAAPQTGAAEKMALWKTKKGPLLRGMVVHPCTTNFMNSDGDPFCDVQQKLKKQDLQDLKDLNANFINASYPGLFNYLPPYELNTEAQQDLDNLINWAEKAGLYVVISARTGPGRNEAAIMAADKRTKYYGRYGNWDIWKDEQTQKKYIEMWQYTANRYKKRNVVIGYSIMVEPHPQTLKSSKYPLNSWEKLAKVVTKAIRSVDAKTPIIIESENWANTQTFPELFVTGDKRTVYSFHSYNPDSYTHQDPSGKVSYLDEIDVDDDGSFETFDKALIEKLDFAPVVEFSQNHGVPIFVGEFGTVRWVPNAVQYHKDVITLFEKYGWNYTAYAWRNNDGDSESDYIYDGFNLEHGPDPENHLRIKNNPLFNVHALSWRKNRKFYGQ
jgi:aryl-phospho-beta-D-glucosidase BglC (GH1 family)